jgi:hypothetical protein
VYDLILFNKILMLTSQIISWYVNFMDLVTFEPGHVISTYNDCKYTVNKWGHIHTTCL